MLNAATQGTRKERTPSLQTLRKADTWSDWRWQLRNAFRRPDDLRETLEGRNVSVDDLLDRRVAQRFPMLVTPYYLSLAREWRPDDPILRQCLPSSEEDTSGENGDPLGEDENQPAPGVIHRYPDRALFLLTNRCAVHCRHCMRKRAWGSAAGHADPARPSCLELEGALAYVRTKPMIREVLLSGGDPLTLPEDLLLSTIADAIAIPHIQTVRLGTRFPVVLPQRFTREFCGKLGALGPLWVATHFNHPYELTPEAEEGCMNLLQAGVPVVNQTVLLRGINDSAEILSDLFTGLLRMRVKPYYLFHADPVAGTMHFRTGLDRGLDLMKQVAKRVSGLALPSFAFDLPQGLGKVRLEPDHITGHNPDGNPLYAGSSGDPVSYD